MSRFLALVVCLLIGLPVMAQEPLVLERHEGWVGAVAFVSADGRQLAVGSSDERIRFWDLERRRVFLILKAHTNAVAALAATRSGDLLVSGSHDHTAVVMPYSPLRRDVGSPHTLRGHRGVVMAVAVAPKLNLIATGSIDSTIRLWDRTQRTEKHVLRGHTSWVNGLSLDDSEERLASAGSDNTVRIWNLKTLQMQEIFTVKEGEVRAVALSPDGKLVAGGLRYGSVRVWDIESKKEVANLQAHSGDTWAVAFTPDGRTLISGGGDWQQPGDVKLWDVETWKEQAALPHSGEVLCLAVSPDGKRLAAGAGDHTVRVWQLPIRARP